MCSDKYCTGIIYVTSVVTVNILVFCFMLTLVDLFAIISVHRIINA